MLRTMNTSEAIKRAGGVAALAKMLGISHQAIYNWGERVPELRAYKLREMKPNWFRRNAQRGVKA